MFKVTFRTMQGNPNGGPDKLVDYFRLFDANSAEELEKKINAELEYNDCGYQRCKKVIDVKRI